MILARLLALLLPLALLAGCGARPKAPAADAPAYGKIHVRYAHQPGDARFVSFDVYRATQAHGPFQRVNAQPIRSRHAPGTVQELLTDQGLVLGRDYYYYVEATDGTGARRKITAVSRATAELPAQREDRAALRRVLQERAAAARRGERPGA